TSCSTSSSATPLPRSTPARRARRAAWIPSAPSSAARTHDAYFNFARRSSDTHGVVSGPLEGLRVLDLGTRIAAPFCAGLLGEMGIGYGGLLQLTGYPDRPPVRVGVTISDYLTGVFSAHAAVASLYARDARRSGQGAVIDAALYGAPLRILEWTIAAYDQIGVVRGREGNRLANSAPLDNYPTADGKYVCIVAGSDANFARLCKAMDRPDLLDDTRFTKLADRATHGDEINGIVTEWTRARSAADIERAC